MSDHPRIRGEHPAPLAHEAMVVGSSPHTRGARFETIDIFRQQGIIPAYAGSTDLLGDALAPIRDHPRIRGEHLGWGSVSPSESRIIPAYAGSTIRPPSRSRRPGDHPRIRGEHEVPLVCETTRLGSSPHTRGARRRYLTEHIPHRIIPAYAGSTIRRLSGSGRAADHPRIRGEHAQGGIGKLKQGGSSPHTRGARRFRPVRDRRPGIIPAYAGSTGLPTIRLW